MTGPAGCGMPGRVREREARMSSQAIGAENIKAAETKSRIKLPIIKEQKRNAGKENNSRIIDWLGRFVNTVAFPLLIIVIWQFLASSGMLLEVILPSPVKVGQAFVGMVEDGTLLVDLTISLQRILKGYFFGAVIAVVLGIAGGLVKFVERLFSPIVNIVRQIPLLAWLPLLILWFGVGELSKTIIIAEGVFIPVYVNTLQGIHSVQNEHRELAKVLELTNADYVTRIVLPSAVSSIFTGLRLSAGNAWMALTAAEMMGGLTGLGYGLINARDFLLSAKLIALMFVIAALGLLCDAIIRLFERVALRWKYIS